MNPTPYVVKKDREGTVRIYHRKLKVAVAEFYHHAAADALAIRAILDGKDEGGLFPAEPEPIKAKARGTLADILAYCDELQVPHSDGEWFFAKCEGSGWKNGGSSIKDWKGVMRSWKIARYLPSLKQTNGSASPAQPRAETIWQLTKAEEAVNESIRLIDSTIIGAWGDLTPERKAERIKLVERRKEIRKKLAGLEA